MLRNSSYKILIICILFLCFVIYNEYQYKTLLKRLLLGIQNTPKCDKVENVVFLKTHKCASSSLQNIFLRYGEKNQLNFAVPKSGHQLYGNNWNLVGNEYNVSYNFFLLHARFKYGDIAKVMGHSNQTTYITMIRDPVDIFVSAWDYYKLGGSYKMTIEEFARAPPSVTKRKSGMLGTNQLLFDLGVDNIYDDDEVNKKIKQMDDRFHLVMILEKFEESLVLMKNILCWDSNDVKNLKLNARKVNADKIISDETRQLLKVIMNQDYKVYNHFKEKFHQKLEEFGSSKMQKEIEELERVNNEITEKCNFEEADNKKLSGKFKWWGNSDLVGYLVNSGNDKEIDEECQLMTMSELSFVDRIRKSQLEKYPPILKQ